MSQAIVELKDRESYSEVDYIDANTTPSGEVHTLYKAYRENYIIKFEWNNNKSLYHIKDHQTSNSNPTNEIDLLKQTVASQSAATEFINILLTRWK